jgi:hypothetical protein
LLVISGTQSARAHRRGYLWIFKKSKSHGGAFCATDEFSSWMPDHATCSTTNLLGYRGHVTFSPKLSKTSLFWTTSRSVDILLTYVRSVCPGSPSEHPVFAAPPSDMTIPKCTASATHCLFSHPHEFPHRAIPVYDTALHYCTYHLCVSNF